MSTNAPNSATTRFTQDPFTVKDAWALIGANARQYCEMMQPSQCKQNSQDPNLQKRCQEQFRKCLAEALRFEAWHRMN